MTGLVPVTHADVLRQALDVALTPKYRPLEISGRMFTAFRKSPYGVGGRDKPGHDG